MYIFGPCLIPRFTEHQNWSSSFNGSSWISGDLPLNLTKVKLWSVPTKFQVCPFLVEIYTCYPEGYEIKLSAMSCPHALSPRCEPMPGQRSISLPHVELETWLGRWLLLWKSSQVLLDFAVTHLFYSNSLQKFSRKFLSQTFGILKVFLKRQMAYIANNNNSPLPTSNYDSFFPPCLT